MIAAVNGWKVLAIVEAVAVVVVWLVVELASWGTRRRPPGVGALREARRARRDRRPW